MVSRVLLVDDNEDDFLLTMEALIGFRDLFALEWAADYDQALACLEAGPFDMCMVDYFLGSRSGLDLIREITARGFKGALILMTGAGYDAKIDEEAMSLGADDYLAKEEVTPQLLKRTLLFNLQRKDTENRFRESEARFRQMAEISSSTLHNIANVLNNLTVSAQTIETLLRQIDPARLKDVVRLLKANTHLAGDPKGKLIPAYLEQVHDYLHQGVHTVAEAVHDSLGKLRLAEEAIGVQQNAMRMRGDEVFSLADLLQEGFALHRSRMLREGITHEVHPSCEVEVRFGRAALLHIFINLIKNAVDALDGCEKKHIQAHADTDDTRLVLSLTDTGQGMPPETLAQMFKHGYTTKTAGNGFGLHFCKQVLSKEGCDIQAHSEGEGKGATFRISIPVEFVASAG